MISRLLTRSLNINFARLTNISNNFLKSDESIQSREILRKIILNTEMRDFNHSSTISLIEYLRNRDIIIYKINCKILSREKTCVRSCL